MNLRSKWQQMSLHYPVQTVFRQQSLCWKDRKWVLMRSNTTLWANTNSRAGNNYRLPADNTSSLLLLSHSPRARPCQRGGDNAPFTSLNVSHHHALILYISASPMPPICLLSSSTVSSLEKLTPLTMGLHCAQHKAIIWETLKAYASASLKFNFTKSYVLLQLKIYPPMVFLTWWSQLHGESFLHLKDSPRLEVVKDARNKNIRALF